MPETRGAPSTIHGIPVPAGSDANAIPADLGALVAVLEGGSILRRLDAAQIAALTPAQRPIGLTVHNLTLGCAQVWDGAQWVAYVLAPRWRDYTVRVRQGSTELPPTGATRARWAQIGQVVHVQVEAVCNPPVGGAVGAVAISLPAAPAGWSLIGTGCIRNNTVDPIYVHAQRVSVSGDAGGWVGFYRENGTQVGDAAIRLTHVMLQATYEAA